MLRSAWLRPRIWDRSFSETARPEASSPALIDPQPRGKLFDVFVHLHALELEDAVGVLGAHVMIDYHLILLE